MVSARETKSPIKNLPARQADQSARGSVESIHDEQISPYLAQSKSLKFAVQPAVIYPGWFVEKMPLITDVWVRNEIVLPAFNSKARGNTLTRGRVHGHIPCEPARDREDRRDEEEVGAR